MGTDIHGVFQRQNPESKVWEDIPHNYPMERHYQLFAVLAGVHNGTGFAGVKTGERINPIAEPRGYPEGFVSKAFEEGCECDDLHPITSAEVIDPRRREWRADGDPMSIWMGDHSHSWLTADEMLAWFETAPTVVHTGILARGVYEEWDHKSRPASYCGGVSGWNVVLVEDNAVMRDLTPNWTHIQCEWDASLKTELAYFFDEVARLKREHGEVRFVFGFDS